MFADNCHTVNAVRSEIVKYSQLENLKNFYISHPQYSPLPAGSFSRERSLPLSELMHFLIYPRAKSTDIELLEFSHLIDRENVNKSDFSKRRRMIPAEYLREMNRDMVRSIYTSADITQWHGRVLLAADGTTYSLPNTPDIRKEYLQGRKTGKGEQALARGVVIKDVLNDVIIASNMECYGRDEIKLLIGEIDKIPQTLPGLSPLIVLDRKFCAYTILPPLLHRGIDFIIRVKERFNTEVDAFITSGEEMRDITLTPASTTIKKLRRLYGEDVGCEFPVRLVRLAGNVVVMSSVRDVPLNQDETDPYHLRWDAETTIGFIKNNLQVEIFSSSKDNSIRQDFHAKTIQYNLLSVLCHKAAELRHDDQPLKINRNIALGILKLEFGIFIRKDSPNFNECLHKVLNEMMRFTIPVKPDRHIPRTFRKIKHSGKYITLHNYREAI